MKGKGTVRSQMTGGWPKPSQGEGNGMGAPFDKPKASGGIPTKVMENDVSKKMASRITPTQTGGPIYRTPRPGTSQWKFGKNDT